MRLQTGNLFWRCHFNANEKWLHFDLTVVDISQVSSLCGRFLRQQLVSFTSAKTPSLQHKVLLRAFQTRATCYYNYTTKTSLLWNHDEEQLLVVTFFSTCLSNLTNCFMHHHTFTFLFRPAKITLSLWRARGLGGITMLLWSQAIKEGRLVEWRWLG